MTSMPVSLRVWAACPCEFLSVTHKLGGDGDRQEEEQGLRTWLFSTTWNV